MTHPSNKKYTVLFNQEFKIWLSRRIHLLEQFSNAGTETIDGNTTIIEGYISDFMTVPLWNKYPEMIENTFTVYEDCYYHIRSLLASIVYTKEYHEIEKLKKAIHKLSHLLEPKSKEDIRSLKIAYNLFIQFITQEKERLYNKTFREMLREGKPIASIPSRIAWSGFIYSIKKNKNP